MATDRLPQQVVEMMKAHLGYDDEEAELFGQEPRNAKVLALAGEMKQKTIVFEVVKSSGCNSHHKVGDRFYFSGDGNLLTNLAPSKMCAFIVPNMTQMIFAIQELWYAGVDPNQLCFKHASCFDVGVKCGGWGKVIVEAKVMSREEARALAGHAE